MSGLTQRQIDQLLKGINPSRVSQAQGHSHVASYEIIAHLIRVFGFCNFDTSVSDVHLVFEQERIKDGKPTNRWDVCYRACVRLTVKDSHGNPIATYEDAATGDGQNQARADGHDLALKSAVSTALKRAARHLGDQYGLSLYANGSTNPVVISTLTTEEPA